ncbi:MAG TPA: hypothetical protein DCQ26_10655 [Marinilabiliales bacterium]|nr:MAG: hypothetical protein A2W95_13800 [Bacteroidetes bacterium GWA2_40_14]OFX58269.1 MAG: hypothetical protein A2W84_16390 [Bacteroidetes bacterium GWC2_40_13]OFX72567.1 MAG: hypothetical protein A2W96_04970 [Bacteroidetes bacterium GWD2_40_43]OFX94145.1 MAG: hypothetical protein A2W97_17640 [Bacteroidetes bacterium GWE2_40_63]OFY20297.1 MAG: hypothetical protein A2W88_12610 [Bacteroidetes bacterium GWF2_40_13]OFZ31833.1 MAG: hypothetical protein A2437_07825 [Bacteroidetes bacterium RIFOXYC
MAQKNLVSATLTDEQRTAVKAAFQNINVSLNFLISLTESQRKDGLRLGDKTVGFLEKFNSYAQSNPEFMPSYFDMNEFRKDYALLKDLSEFIKLSSQLQQKLEDTYTETGIESLSVALVYYNSVKAAAKNGIAGAQAIYDDLRKRFPGGSGTTSGNTPTT